MATNLPKAYLTIVFFNERFEYVGEGSTALRVSQSGDNAAPLVLSNIKAPKNGYAYIYLSNENDDAVYFDNFTVSDNRGRIIEENHYYAFGLKIDGISSVKMGDANEGSLKNNYQYQGDYSEMDEDISWNEFDLRDYDPQVGRFVQQDAFNQFPSAYTGMGNDPINLIDPSGGIGIPCPGTSQLGIFFMKAGEAIGKGLDALGKVSPLLSAGIDVARFGTGLYNNSVQFRMIDRQLAGNMTVQVGDVNSPDDIIHVNTKAKKADILKTNDDYDYDWVITDEGKPEKRVKGETEKYLKENDYSIFHPKAVGNAVSDVASAFFLGSELYPILKWFFKAKPTKNVPRPPKYPTDPTKPPADGWEWRGRPDSKPGSKDGNWYNPSTKESLRPDLDHPDGIDPHYDYRDPEGNWYRYFQDGRLIKKP